LLVSLGVKASCCLPQNAFWGLHHYQLLYLHTFFCNCRCVFLINLIFYILISNNWKHGCRVSVYFINTLCKSNIAYLFRKYNVMFQFNYGLKHFSLTLTYFVFAWLPFLAYLHVLIWWNSNCSCVITTLLRSVQKDCLCFLTTLGWCIQCITAFLRKSMLQTQSLFHWLPRQNYFSNDLVNYLTFAASNFCLANEHFLTRLVKSPSETKYFSICTTCCSGSSVRKS